MKTRDEIFMQVRKEWDESWGRWRLSVSAGGFMSEIFCYEYAEKEYFACINKLVDHAYQMQSV
jgi:hypothetical protein